MGHSIFVGFALAFAVWTGCETHRPDACPHCAATTGETNAAIDVPQVSVFLTQWLAPEQRKAAIPAFGFENQEGNKISLAEFRGAPVALSFIYTRCQNERKCPMVARAMGQLAEAATSLLSKPKILLISYDPEFDTPAHLKAFSGLHGFACSEDAMLLRPELKAKDELIKSLNVPVNYNQSGVNLHGIQLVLLDKQGRFVRKYHSLLWNNHDVLKDLSRLAAE